MYQETSKDTVCNDMAFISLKDFLSRMGVGTPGQFDEWTKAWRLAVEGGSQESLLAFICRERGLAEDVFLQQLAQALNWPYLELPKVNVPIEARNRISTKVAFQYSVLPTQIDDGAVQVAVSNPFDAAMLNAVRFDAHGPVEFALATKVEIEKALKKYYGVGAETLDEMAEDEPMELLVGEDKEITEGDQEASVIKFVNQVIWEAYKDRATDIHFEPDVASLTLANEPRSDKEASDFLNWSRIVTPQQLLALARQRFVVNIRR